MLEQYFPVLVFIIIGCFCGLVPITIGSILGPKNPTVAKLSPYECGFDPFESARIKFDVRFYLIAILFIIFDLRSCIFIPMGCSIKEDGFWPGFVAMGMIFWSY